MKKTLLKIFAVLALIVSTALIFIFGTYAEDNQSYTVEYISNGNVMQTETVVAGGKHLIRTTKLSATQQGKTFFGWYTEEGRFFTSANNGLGMQINVNSDITLYEAYGTAVTTAADFKRCIVQNGPGNYIKLNSNITINETMTLPNNGFVIIDLNEHKLTINTEGNAFEGTNATVHIVDSSKNHSGIIEYNCSSTDSLVTNALFNYSPANLTKDVVVKVFPPYDDAKAITITTNVGFFNVATDISNSDYTFKFDLPATLSANYLVHSSGMRNATVDVSKITKMTFNGSRILEDKGSNDGKVLTFNIDAGAYTIDTKTIFTNEQNRYNLFLTGGSFNRDIKALFENENYTFKLNNTTKLYDFSSCAHNNEIIDMTVTCTESGTITNRCLFCNLVAEAKMAALGHSKIKTLTKEASYGSETTDAAPGEYTISCQRCDYTDIELYYPSAKDVYVRVGLADGTIIRVPASIPFGKSIDKQINTYTPVAIESLYGVNREDIVSIEIPLGIEVIAGQDGIDGAKIGAFYQDEHLEEIILPKSIKTVKRYAFSEMSKLKRIIGLEYITDTIDAYAFRQTENSVFVMDHIVLNAVNIGEESFKNVRMKTLTFGKNVNNISNNAFALDSSLATILVEIFVEENKTLNNAKLSEISGAFSSIGSGHQFGSNNIVFTSHGYTTEVIKPTCNESGYSKNYCTRCGESSTSDYVDPVPHDFSIEVTIPSSCAVRQGEILNKCTTCEETKHVKWLDPAPDNHIFEGKKAYFTNKYVEITNICTQDYLILDVCACGKTVDRASVFANGGPQKAKGEHTLDYASPIKTVDPTCKESGYQELRCKICDEEETVVLEPTGRHDFDTLGVEKIAPTCVDYGYNKRVCAHCGEVKLTKTNERPNPTVSTENDSAHIWDGKWVTTKEATTQSVGEEQQTCTACGAKKTRHTAILAEKAEKQSKTWLIVIGIVGGIIVVGLTGVLLYYTLFKKNPAKKHKYNFDSYSTRRD